MASSANPKKLGRYEIVKHLATGGMADVLLARTTGPSSLKAEGFARHVVLKRIRAEAAHDRRYVEMLLDEARLAASLHHHNIVQVNDIGEVDGEPFFTMEYVHGEDARTLLANLAEAGKLMPLEHVLAIVCAAAAGLHHAHEQRGPRGSLGIVHRDVSPANILIGYDGGVKVLDFGIAKAAHRSTETRSGTLKGKVAYMSPEQCVCDAVDRRSDVFSLGIVLYELLTVRRLFKGENDFMTMTAIVLGYIPPPSTYRPNIPSELEEITLKALANKPEDRYQTADELRIALEQVAARLQLSLSTTALADYMKQRFGTRPEPWLDGVEIDPTADLGIDFDGSASGVVRVPIDAVPAVETMRLGAKPAAPNIVISDVEHATGSVIQLIPKSRADTQAATGQYSIPTTIEPVSKGRRLETFVPGIEPSPLDDVAPVPAAPIDDEVPIIADDVHEVDVVDLDDIDDAPAPAVAAPTQPRRIRMLLAILAVVFAVGAIGSALWLARGSRVEPLAPPSAVVVPHAVKPAPARIVQPDAAPVAPQPIVEDKPAVKPPVEAKPPIAPPLKPAKKPVKKWDPNSLFIE